MWLNHNLMLFVMHLFGVFLAGAGVFFCATSEIYVMFHFQEPVFSNRLIILVRCCYCVSSFFFFSFLLAGLLRFNSPWLLFGWNCPVMTNSPFTMKNCVDVNLVHNLPGILTPRPWVEGLFWLLLSVTRLMHLAHSAWLRVTQYLLCTIQELVKTKYCIWSP